MSRGKMSKSLDCEKIQQVLHYCEDQEKEEEDDDEEEGEEEALSLCDLPTATAGGDEGGGKRRENETGDCFDFDFDFGSSVGPVSTLEPEMCAADEVFSGGQMLPFRHSVSSSEAGPPGFRALALARSSSRSEGSRSTSSSSSSRSSSTKSCQSSTSASSSTTSTSTSIANKANNFCVKRAGTPKPKAARNQFHSHPSPRPQLRASGHPITVSPPSGPKSTMWQVLKLGLVRAPEIELRTSTGNSNCNKSLFITTRATRNGSISSSSSSSNSSKIGDLLLEMERREKLPFPRGKNDGGFFKSCKCSVGAIEPMPTRRISKNSGARKAATSNGGQNYHKSLSSQLLLNEDKKMAEKNNNNNNNKNNKNGQREDDDDDDQVMNSRQKQVRQAGKKVVSHHRTFEWLRDLSHASVLNS